LAFVQYLNIFTLSVTIRTHVIAYLEKAQESDYMTSFSPL